MSEVVVVHGSYFVNNFGDTLLVKLLCDKIAVKVGKHNVFLARAGSEKEQSYIGYPVLDKTYASNVSKVVYSGGGYFGEPKSGFLRSLRWSARNYFRHLFWLRHFKKAEIHIVGVGVGPISNILYRFKVGDLLRRAKTVLVRDIESKKYCTEYYPMLNNVEMCVDMALGLNAVLSSKKGIGLHIDGLTLDEITLILLATKESDIFKKNQTLAILFDNDFSYNTTNINKYQKAAINAGFEFAKLKFVPYDNCENMIARLASFELIVTNKLHVGIVSITQGTPVLSIPTHQKTIRLYKQLEIAEFCILRKNLSLEKIVYQMRNYKNFAVDRSIISKGILFLNMRLNDIFS
jgi:hypothetical protein